MSNLKAALRLLLFTLWTIPVVVFQLLLKLFTDGPLIYVIPRIWHRGVCFIFGIKVQIEGTPRCDQQVIYVSNHLSYLDIPIIGSFLKASFVAKEDVAKWPVFGFLSKLQNTAFISRNKRAAIRESNNILSMLSQGRSLIIFPEGTSTDGQTVRAFKSSLFASVLEQEDNDLLIQPFTVQVVSSNKSVPQTQDERDYYAWHINMDTEMPVHLWRFAKGCGATIALKFHAPIPVKEHHDRRAMLNQCHESVLLGLNSGASAPTIASKLEI